MVERGGGLQLRVDGTLASFHRPGRAVTGPVWWALAAPLTLLPARPRRRVLILGLGAGSVAAVVRRLDPGARIVGVERDREVLRLARQHFGLDALDVEVVEDDVFHYLRCARGRFDLVVEDVFVGSLRKVHKPTGLLNVGYDLFRRRLSPRGLVVSNTIHESPAVARAMKRFGPRVVSLDVKRYWNRIVIGGADVPRARDLRRRLASDPRLVPLLSRVAVRER